jgi:AraC-like DNA-binding protein
MSINRNHLVLDNPNIPVYTGQFTQAVKFAELLDVSGEVGSYFDPETITEGNQLNVQDMYLPHFSIRFFSGEFTRDAVLVNARNQFTDEVLNCFFYDGNLKAFVGNNQEVSMRGGTQLLRYDPQNEIKCWCGGNKPFHVVRIFSSPEYFLDLLPGEEPWVEPVRNKVLKKEKILETGTSMVTQAQQNILHGILNCPLTGKAAQLMIETSALQLILLQLHSMKPAAYDNYSKAKISKRDAELMWSVKEYLNKTFLDDHTMQSLTKEFGTNKFKLNVAFKSLFGLAPFELIRNLKMDLAKQWLSDGVAVGEVAHKLGYKNPHHFTAAFKKRFNSTPSQFRS